MYRLLAIPAALLLLLAGSLLWSGGGTEKSADFTFINRGEIGTLDPNRMSWLQDIRVGYALWEGLYTLDPKTLDPVLGVAKSVDVSPDATVYTFHLRPDAKWSNGKPVLTGDFVYAWRRMLEKPGDYTYLFFYIRGAEEYSTACTAAADKPAALPAVHNTFDKVGIEAIDNSTLRVTLKHPVTFFPDLCAFPSFFPLYKPGMVDDKGEELTDWIRPPKLVSNGAYRLDKWEFKKRVRFVASDYYWDRGSVKSPIIDMLSSSDDQLSPFLQYDTGRVDWQAEVVGEIASELRKKGRTDLHIFPGFGTYFYSINCQPTLPSGALNPFADVRVRKAFSMAIDKTKIVNDITRLGEQPANDYVPPGIFKSYASPKGLEYNVEAARALLAQAGYPGGRGFPKVELLFNNEGQHPRIAEYVRKQWDDNLGVSLDMAGVEIKTFRNRLHQKQYAVARASWIGDYKDPSTFTDKYLSESDNNDSGWKNPAYDALCRQAEYEKDPVARLAILNKAEQLLIDEAPIIPLYYYTSCYLFRDNVQGVPLDPRNMVMLKSVEKVKTIAKPAGAEAGH